MHGVGSLLASAYDGDERPAPHGGSMTSSTGINVDEVPDNIRKAFRALDLDDNGTIEVGEVSTLLTSLDPDLWTQEKIDEFIAAVDMNGDGILQYDEFVTWLSHEGSSDETSMAALAAAESAADVCPPSMKPCRYGATCYNRKPQHRLKLWHPDHAQLEGKQRQACKFGAGCYRKNRGHLEVYCHPGDRNYRKGLVFFQGRGNQSGPQFETMEQLFNYYDVDESGYLTKDDFQELFEQLKAMSKLEDASLDLDTAWDNADGNASGYLNFARVAAWATNAGIDLPLGLETMGAQKPCRFTYGRGGSCACEEFEDEADGICVCGHKKSAHRANMSVDAANAALSSGLNWEEGQSGLVEVTSADVIQGMQELLNASHKDHDNWTRDRGCKIHGRGHPDCPWSCIRSNSNPVPTGFLVKKVFRNQNRNLWNHYAITKKQILDDLQDAKLEFQTYPVKSQADLDSPLTFEACNEWRLWHGTSLAACQGISATNFRLSLSGTGATWKEPGAEKGSPLYGFGIYLAEHITKSDEYAGSLPEGDPDEGCNCVLLCRAVGGLSNLCTTNEIDKAKLKNDVFNGPYHSVFGDRVVTLGKPYREIVLYDKDQIFPEFVVYYQRLFD